MSLINDALKRARQAQEQAPLPASHGPQFFPADPAQAARKGLGLMLPAALAVAALLILFLLWRLAGIGSASLEAKAASSPNVTSQPSASVPPGLAADTSGGGSGFASAQPVQTAAVATTPDVRASSVEGSAPVNGQGVDATVATNRPAASEGAVPKPLPPKLQGIVWNPKRPSAVINGKTLFVGDRFGDFRVLAIHQDSATLVQPGRTNVLMLESY